MTRTPRPAAAALALACLLAAGCAAPARPRANAAAAVACRNQTEVSFNRQNRDLLSYRSQVDTPFSTSFDSGITTAGLSRQFERDQMMSACLNSSGAAANDGTSFSPRATGTDALPPS